MILNFPSKRKVALSFLVLNSFSVRVRFAPSPTGDMHLGGIRTALFNYLFAKQNNGTFILRIQDTDQKRHVEQSTFKIFETLKWLRINPDQSMLNPNPKYEPYVQSHRKHLYQYYAEKLLADKKAFYCFCDQNASQKGKQQQTQNKGYKGKCLKLSQQKVKQNIKNGYPFAIRIKSGFRQLISNIFIDEIYGQVKANKFDDFVIIKRDGFPTFHFANIIDDAKMQITHVIRGEQWLTNTPKHIYLYKILGFEPPKFMHLPLLLSSDGKKLSKRNKFSSFNWVLEQGYLPQAIVNFSALLGWTSKVSTNQFFAINDLIKQFSIQGISRNPVRVNQKKLNHYNKLHLKVLLETGGQQTQQFLLKMIQQQIDKSYNFCQNYRKGAKNMIIPRINNFSEIKLFSYFFNGAQFISEGSIKDFNSFFGKNSKICYEKLALQFTQKLQYLPYNIKPSSIKIKAEGQEIHLIKRSCEIIQKLYKIFQKAGEFSDSQLSTKQSLKNLVYVGTSQSDITSKQVYHLLRFIITGYRNGPDTIQLIKLFGFEYIFKSLLNFKIAIQNLQVVKG